MVLTFEGTLEIHLDYVSYIVKPNSFITIMPTHALQLDRIGKDFKGRLLIASKEFLNDCNPGGGNRTQAIANYMEIRKNPCTGTGTGKKQRNWPVACRLYGRR